MMYLIVTIVFELLIFVQLNNSKMIKEYKVSTEEECLDKCTLQEAGTLSKNECVCYIGKI